MHHDIEAPPFPGQERLPHSVLSPAQPHNLREWVELLANEIGPRPARFPTQLATLAQYLESAFRNMGYRVDKQPHRHGNRTYFNVIASPNSGGSQRDGVELLIVGAHYDTVSTSPGADDNGSGIAGLLELARILANAPPPSLRLVAFCPEEPPAFRTRNMGSYIYARELKKNKVRVQGMICLEMIGYFADAPGSQSYPLPGMKWFYPDRGNFIALVGNLKSRRWTRLVKEHFIQGTDLPVEHLNAPGLVFGIDFSDHWSFNRHGFPAVMVTDTAFYRTPHYHRPSDLPATLDYHRSAKVIDGLAHAVHHLG